MKTFATAILLASANAVNVMKAKSNPAYASEPVIVEEVAVVAQPDYGNAEVWAPAPRYWDDHLHYEGPTKVNFTKPEPFKAQAVDYRVPAFLPYIPKYKNNYVDVK